MNCFTFFVGVFESVDGVGDGGDDCDCDDVLIDVLDESSNVTAIDRGDTGASSSSMASWSSTITPDISADDEKAKKKKSKKKKKKKIQKINHRSM
jgi:hypothetical protein